MKTRNVMICAALVGIGSVVAACDNSHDLSPTERMTAELGARQFAGSTADLQGVSGRDSDGDGYVTATLRNRQAPHETVSIVCSYKEGSVGCKGK